MKKTKEQKSAKLSGVIKENTFEMDKEIALESFKKRKDVFERVLIEGEDKENLTIEDTKEAGYELLQSQDEIERYRP